MEQCRPFGFQLSAFELATLGAKPYVQCRDVTPMALPDEREKKGVMEIVTSWMEKGIERGMQQGMQQGMLQKAHEDILDVLEARFGEMPYELRERVLAVTQEAELKRLHRQSALAESMAAFRAKLSSKNKAES